MQMCLRHSIVHVGRVEVNSVRMHMPIARLIIILYFLLYRFLFDVCVCNMHIGFLPDIRFLVSGCRELSQGSV